MGPLPPSSPLPCFYSPSSRKKRREELLLQKNINWSLLSRHGGLKEAQEEGQLLDEEGGGAARLFFFSPFSFSGGGTAISVSCLFLSSALLPGTTRYPICPFLPSSFKGGRSGIHPF